MTTAAPNTLAAVAAKAREAGVFGEVMVEGARLIASAKAPASPAFYRVWSEAGRTWVGLVTADRWLSQSIEQDLVHTGDKMEDLLLEELVELGYDGPPLKVEHFRDDDKLFTFRSSLASADADLALQVLLGYEACFRRLGDMEAGEE